MFILIKYSQGESCENQYCKFSFLPGCKDSFSFICHVLSGIGDHRSPQLPDRCYSLFLLYLFSYHSLSKLLSLHLLLSPSVCPVSITFYKFSFLIMCSKRFTCLFLCVNGSFFVVPILLKTFSLFTGSANRIPDIRQKKHVYVVSCLFFIYEEIIIGPVSEIIFRYSIIRSIKFTLYTIQEDSV